MAPHTGDATPGNRREKVPHGPSPGPTVALVPGRRVAVGAVFKSADVPEREETTEHMVARPFVRFTLQGGDVIWPHHSVEVNVAVGPETFRHVRLPIVVERFLELLDRSPNVAEVHEGYPVRPDAPDHISHGLDSR